MSTVLAFKPLEDDEAAPEARPNSAPRKPTAAETERPVTIERSEQAWSPPFSERGLGG